MANVRDDRRYAESHEWVKVDGDIATIGISDYAQHALGDIVYVDLPEVGDEFAAGDVFGAVESVKAASDLICPVSGEVIEINEDLEDAPEKINQDAFDSWIIKIRMADPKELEAVMDAAKYAELCENE